MTNRFMRGSAPGRAQPAYLRPGSFNQGHEKRGGRKRGTPNLFSIDYKKPILEAAYRIGRDGNGKDGVVGYLSWVAEYHPRIFCSTLYMHLLAPGNAESDVSEEPRRTVEESIQSVRDYIGLTTRDLTKEQTVQVESESPWDWTGQPFPVGSLMQIAVAHPKGFCTLLAGAFLRPSTKRRRLAERAAG
jgi:hypothetical protein